MTTETPLSPYQQHQADIRSAYEAFRFLNPFKGLRVAYNTPNAAMKDADVARAWWAKTMHYLTPDVDNLSEARRYLRGTLERIDSGLASEDLTERARVILVRARPTVAGLSERMDAADARRDEANKADRDAKAAAFPRNRRRASQFEDMARVAAISADFFDFFGVECEVKWGTSPMALAPPLGQCAELADAQDLPAVVGVKLREAAGFLAENKRGAWRAIYEAEQAMEER